MRRVLTVWLILLVVFSASPQTYAYTLQYADAGAKVKVRWATNRIEVHLSSSLSQPQPNIKTGSDVLGAIERALKHWSDVANIEFVLVHKASEQSVSPLESGGDGKSLITIAPTAENFALFASDANETAGRTRLFYTKSGRITEADIVLNPYQQFSTDGTNSTYDIESTITHELGHLLGLEHSCVMGATMQPRQGKNGLYELQGFAARTLSEDDKAGVRALYGGHEEEPLRGSIIGKVTDERGLPVFGAHVWVEDVKTGKVIASTLSLSNGTYRLSSIEEGDYRLMIEAMDGPIPLNELISKRSVYAALLSSQIQSFPTQEIGSVNVEDGTVVTVNAEIETGAPSVNLKRIGFNSQISTVSVPINGGRTYMIFISGQNINAKNISVENISFSSPFIKVISDRVAEYQTVSNASVISFEIEVNQKIEFGEYSLRVQTRDGELACLVGALTVDDIKNDWFTADKRLFSGPPATLTED